jgi:pimeloyl-ACP methyl ester carboxylesterase
MRELPGLPGLPGLIDVGGGVRLDCEITGAGAPVLLVRPLGGSMALWGDFATRLAASFRVIAFDPRGVGRSSHAPMTITTRAMARDAIALLDALGVARAHVFGESLGGMVASWLAAFAPARVDHLVLASTIPDATAISRRAIGRAASVAACFARRGRDVELCLVRRAISPQLSPARWAEIEAAIRATPATRRDLLALSLAAARHREPRFSAPTLLLFGARDPIAGRASRDELVRDVSGAALEMIEGAAHALTLERPHEIADRVLAFLR